MVAVFPGRDRARAAPAGWPWVRDALCPSSSTWNGSATVWRVHPRRPTLSPPRCVSIGWRGPERDSSLVLHAWGMLAPRQRRCLAERSRTNTAVAPSVSHAPDDDVEATWGGASSHRPARFPASSEVLAGRRPTAVHRPRAGPCASTREASSVPQAPGVAATLPRCPQVRTAADPSCTPEHRAAPGPRILG
jgi:hypothetical protein